MSTLLYIAVGVVGVVAAFIALQLMAIHRMRRQQGKPAPELSGKPGQRIKKGRSAMFYFYSPACGACRAMTPIVQKLAKSKEGVYPIDISRDMDTGRKFGVMATPTTVVVDKGIVQQVLIGPQPRTTLEQLV